MKRMIGWWKEYGVFLLLLILLDLVFAVTLWLSDNQSARVLMGVFLSISLLLFGGVVGYSLKRERKKKEQIENVLRLAGDERNLKMLPSMTQSQQQLWEQTFWRISELEQALEDQRRQRLDYEEYIENWAHEIKVPLSLLELLLDNHRSELNEYLYQRLLYVNQQTQQQVGQILYYARLKAVHKDYVWKMYSLRELCQTVLSEFSLMLEEKQIQVINRLSEQKVLTDEKGISFVLGQIVSNAIKYIDETKAEHTILLEDHYEEATQKICLVITDNGVGVGREDLPFLFEKGYTGDSRLKKGKATGMGLYLASEMADDLSVKLSADSEKGRYFSITIEFAMVIR